MTFRKKTKVWGCFFTHLNSYRTTSNEYVNTCGKKPSDKGKYEDELNVMRCVGNVKEEEKARDKQKEKNRKK